MATKGKIRDFDKTFDKNSIFWQKKDGILSHNSIAV